MPRPGPVDPQPGAVLDAADISRALTRIAHEILERNKGAERRGPARHPHPRRAAGRAGSPRGSPRSRARRSRSASLDVTMYRDDLRLRPARALERTDIPPGGIDGADRRARRRRAVLRPHHPGRAGRARATSAGPRAVQLAVLVDRGHRELPIRADYVGKNLPDLAARDASGCSSTETRRRATPCCSAPRPTQPPRRSAREAAPALRRRPDRDDALLVLDTAEELRRSPTGRSRSCPTLRGRTVVNLFFEDSTRTRISFEAAAKRLSADVINFSAKGSSVSKGESLKDTALTLEAMGADAVVIRHARPARRTGWPLGLDRRQRRQRRRRHPRAPDPGAARRVHHAPRASGDAATGRRVTIVGDVLHSRVARSNVLLLRTLGAEVTLVAPPTLLPVGVEAWPCETSYDLDGVLPKTDAVMMLRVQRERMNGRRFFPSAAGVQPPLRPGRAGGWRTLPDHAIVMHPGPMNRGMEIAADVADSARSVIVEQVANGVSVRMAVLYLLLGGREPAIGTRPTPAKAMTPREHATS